VIEPLANSPNENPKSVTGLCDDYSPLTPCHLVN
jgi:hypothetical protein